MTRFIAAILIIVAGTKAVQGADQYVQLARTLQSRIDAFHRKTADREHRLRLVYFHPNDAPPQKGYRERITRIMLDIRKFISLEMKRNGFHDRSIRLEMDGDLVKLHVVEGRDGTDAYNYDQRYGAKILRELRSALKGTINFDRDYVLTFCGICPQDDQGVYHFRSPYYDWGGSDVRRGMCFAADCEMLDTKHFTATNQTFRYTEHQGPFTKTLAAFNSLYIGGIAHELGHGLGLPHNREKPWEKKKLGRALMGSGNFTYRTEQVGGKGSFLTRASALRLAAHPMFTGSDRQRFANARFKLSDLNFKKGRTGLKVTGHVEGSPEIFAVIGYTDPEGGSNYDAYTWISEVKNGRFEINVASHRRGPHELRLNFCHLNGSFTKFELPYNTGDGYLPKIDGMNAWWSHGRVEQLFMAGKRKEAVALAKKNLKQNAEGQSADKLRHLIHLTEKTKLEDLSNSKATRLSLSNAKWSSAKVGWGRPARNHYYTGNGIRDGVCIELNGEFHPQAIYAHAPARHVFQLNKRWRKFTATVGLKDGVGPGGTGVFIVRGDGRELHRTKRLGPRQTAKIDLDVSGISELQLITESGKQGNGGCWTIWGSPYVAR